MSHANGSTLFILAVVNERGDRSPGSTTAVGAGEQCIFPCNGLGPDGPLDNVGVDLDAPVGQEALEVLRAARVA